MSTWLGTLFSGIVIWLVSSMTAAGQVLVYQFQFSQEKGVNYHTFETGFFVVPVLGGKGSFILAAKEDRTYITAADSGQMFPAGDGDTRKSVITATTSNGTARGQLVAIGLTSHELSITSPSVKLTVSVAKMLQGTAVFADSEGGTGKGGVLDSTFGSAGTSELRMTLEEGHTSRANDDGLDVAAALERLTKVIEAEGYGPATSSGASDQEDESDKASSSSSSGTNP
ncbi:MAG: hypothetical protein ACAI34_11185 [Verrucomicrobium sp.]|nr:hypothetical protein [Verrucomicrobium sp.]